MEYGEIVPNELLIRARLEKGWTQSQLAEEVGTTFETVSRWERGVVLPGPYFRTKLCSAFGKSPTELGFDKVGSDTPLAAGPPPSVFLSSAYADADRKFVVSLKKEMQMRGIVLWSSRTVKRQSLHRKGDVLQEAIRTVQLVLVIVSPHTRGSNHVEYTRALARHYRRPVCVVWIEGESIQECLPEQYGDPGVVIDARVGEERYLHNKIISTIERTWLSPSDPGTAGLSEPMWAIPELTRQLIGRDELLLKVGNLLRGPHTRLVILSGPGGIGKTHLALHAAMKLREHFVDGACFVTLAAISDPNLVIPTVAKALNIREVGESMLLEQVKVALKNKHFLLLLDNYEHVQEAAQYLPELLAACPHLKIIVTSRSRMRRLGERSQDGRMVLLELESLSPDAAMALFRQRAQVARANFEITPANAPIIAEICERLDRLPLAIELAAARTESMSTQLLLDHLKDQPHDTMEHFMVDPYRDADDRQHSLYSTIEWSYNSLTAWEQQLFRQLAVFAGSCGLEAIEAICDPLSTAALPVWKGVESLLEKSLIQSAEKAGEGRLHLLETIREYGLERLKASGEDLATKRLHATYFLRLVEEAESHLKGEQQARWLGRLELEQENLRAALDWFITHEEPELALRFCGAMWRFWHLRGYWSEGRHWLEAALSASQEDVSMATRAWALCVAGNLAYYQDDNSVARALLEESAALCRMLELDRELAVALGTLVVLVDAQDGHAAAAPLLAESEQLCLKLGSSWEVAYLLRRVAQYVLSYGELKHAVTYAQEGLFLAKKLGDKSLTAYTLGTLGAIAAYQGDMQQSIEYFQESLSNARELNDKHLIASTLNSLVYFKTLQSDVSMEVDAQEALAQARELGDRLLISRALHTLGTIAIRQNNAAQAALWFREGLSQALEISYNEGIGWDIYGLALIAEEEGQFQSAARLFGAMEAWLDVNVDMNPAEQAEYTRAIEHVRAHLGKRPFAAVRSEGRGLTPGQILVAPRSAPVVGTPPSPKYPNGLTRREVEVLCLVAEGLANKAIAQKLHIELRTVTTYLTTVYSKIRVSSDGKEGQIAQRVAAAHFVEDHDLC